MGQIGPSQRADAMFLEFSVANFRSFKDRATLSMEATTDDWLEETHIANVGGRRLARTVAVYGANAGGKSNLLLAMSTFREFLKNSSKLDLGKRNHPGHSSPFRNNTANGHPDWSNQAI